jgi:hypothetical protein
MKIGNLYIAITDDKYSSDENGLIYELKSISGAGEKPDYMCDAVSPPIRPEEFFSWKEIPFTKEELNGI